MKKNRLLSFALLSTLVVIGYSSVSYAAAKAVNGLAVLKTDEKTQFNKTSAERHFELLDGTALIQPKQSVDIQIKNGFIKVAPGSVVLLSMKDGVACVTNLCDSSDHSVTIKFGDCSLRLATGKQAWFGPSEALVAAAVKEEAGRPTLVRQHQTANVGTIAEFTISPAIMLDSSPIVESMRDSQLASDRKVYNRIVKASAALTMLR